MKLKFILPALFLMSFFSCSSDNEDSGIVYPQPKEQWSETMKGNGEVLGAYPDLYSNYWEYTYNVNENPDVALCIKGEFGAVEI